MIIYVSFVELSEKCVFFMVGIEDDDVGATDRTSNGSALVLFPIGVVKLEKVAFHDKREGLSDGGSREIRGEILDVLVKPALDGF